MLSLWYDPVGNQRSPTFGNQTVKAYSEISHTVSHTFFGHHTFVNRDRFNLLFGKYILLQVSVLVPQWRLWQVNNRNYFPMASTAWRYADIRSEVEINVDENKYACFVEYFNQNETREYTQTLLMNGIICHDRTLEIVRAKCLRIVEF